MPSGSEEAIQRAILYGGPVTASIHTYGDQLELHNDGRGSNIFMGEVEKTPSSGGHAIVLFGWGTQGGTKYWLARNTWGRSWPKNAETPGIFKIHRGSNRNEIESGETAFSLVSNIPGVGSVENSFVSINVCEAMSSPERSEALGCISIENRDMKCILKNTCREKAVSLVESTSLSVVDSSSNDREACGRIIPDGATIAPQQEYPIDGLNNCCVIKAKFAEAAATCLELKMQNNRRRRRMVCVATNNCGKAMRAKISRGNGFSYIDFTNNRPTIVDDDFCKPGVQTEEL